MQICPGRPAEYAFFVVQIFDVQQCKRQSQSKWLCGLFGPFNVMPGCARLRFPKTPPCANRIARTEFSPGDLQAAHLGHDQMPSSYMGAFWAQHGRQRHAPPGL